MSGDAFTEAQKPDGKHHGFYQRYKDEPLSFLRRGIRSLEQQIAEHEEKLSHPDSVSGFTEASTRQQEALNHHWSNEIQNFREQQVILERILEQRHERSD